MAAAMHAGRVGAFLYRSACKHVELTNAADAGYLTQKEAYTRNTSTFILAPQHLTPTLPAQHLTGTPTENLFDVQGQGEVRCCLPCGSSRAAEVLPAAPM